MPAPLPLLPLMASPEMLRTGFVRGGQPIPAPDGEDAWHCDVQGFIYEHPLGCKVRGADALALCLKPTVAAPEPARPYMYMYMCWVCDECNWCACEACCRRGARRRCLHTLVLRDETGEEVTYHH